MTASRTRNPIALMLMWLGVLCGAAAQVQAQAQAQARAQLQSPTAQAPSEPFTETRHGIDISDPYRWMEQPERQAAMNAWLRTATEQGMAQLAQLPERAAWVQVLRQASQPGTRYGGLVEVGERQFVRRTLVGESTAKLVLRQGGRERVLFDPTLTAGLALNSFSVAPDGRTVGLIASKDGSEVGEARFIDTASGREIGQRFGPVWGEIRPRWLDARRVLLVRMGNAPQGNPMATMVAHVTTLGGQAKPVFGFGLPGLAASQPPEFPIVVPSTLGPWTLAYGAGARADFRVLISRTADVAAGRPHWQVLASYDDRVSATTVLGNTLYLLTTRERATGQVWSSPLLADGRIGPRQLVAEGDGAALTGLEASRDGIYLSATRNGETVLRFLPQGRGPGVVMQLPFEGSADAMGVAPNGRSLTIGFTGWTRPRVHLRTRGARLVSAGLNSAGWAAAETIQAVRTEARSADGTLVPFVVLRAAGAKGPQPALLEAYGAYGLPTVEPVYNAPLLAWVSRGRTLALCGTRGGNERGRDWHEGGREANKPNAHADFIACGEALVAQGLTTPAQLAAMGTSAGGLLSPVAALQRPDLFRALVPRVAVINPTRLEAMANGPNQYAEMGDPRTEAGFKALASQDATLLLQQRVQRDPIYRPPHLFITLGLNDQRVAPWMPAKFAASALALAGERRTVFVRADGAQGHGVGSQLGRQIDEMADTFTFLDAVLDPSPTPR